MSLKRLVIHTADVMALTGRSETYARRLLRAIRQAEGKQTRDMVTVEEFCRFTRIKREEVEGSMNTH